MTSGRMVTTSRRAGRVTNKTKLLVYRGSDKVDLSAAETIVWNSDSASGEATKNQHVGAKGVETGELLVSSGRSTTFPMHAGVVYIGRSPSKRSRKSAAAWEPHSPDENEARADVSADPTAPPPSTTRPQSTHGAHTHTGTQYVPSVWLLACAKRGPQPSTRPLAACPMHPLTLQCIPSPLCTLGGKSPPPSSFFSPSLCGTSHALRSNVANRPNTDHHHRNTISKPLCPRPPYSTRVMRPSRPAPAPRVRLRPSQSRHLLRRQLLPTARPPTRPSTTTSPPPMPLV